MKKALYILSGILVLHILLLSKLKFTAWPEMLLWPYLWLQEILPYKDIAIVHTPLLIAKLTIFYKLVGVGILQLKIFNWFLIIVSDLVVFWVTKRLWNQKTAIAAVSVFAFWQMFFDGNGLWFDSMLVPLSVITFYLVQKKKYFWTGVFWALMFFTKQTAVWFLIPIGWQIVRSEKLKVKSLLNPIYGSLVVFGTFLLLLLSYHLLPSFYNWAINFGIFILPASEGQIQLPDLRNLVLAGFPFLVFVPLILKSKFKNAGLLVWSLAGIMGAYPRFEYFHFQPGISFLAMASALILANLSKEKKYAKVLLLLYLIGSLYLFANFFIRNWGEGTRFYEQDVVDVSNYVKTNTTPKDKIFVMNWWENIYPLTETVPATDPWVPQLSWYQESSGIQEKEISDLENSKPKLILLQDYSETGLASYKPQKVYDYVMANYKLKEKVEGIEVLIPR